MTRNIILIALTPLLIFGCSDDKNPVGQANGTISGRVTAGGVGISGVTITVSGYVITEGGSPKPGSYSIFQSSAIDGDYSVDVLPATYRIDFSIVYNSEWLNTARYPIVVASGSEVIVDVDLKNPIPVNLIVNEEDAAVNVSWEPGYGAESHRIYRAATGQNNFEQIKEIMGEYNSTLSIVDIPPDIGSFTYKVTGVSGGIESEASEPAAIDFTGNIGAPTSLTAVDFVTHVVLNWDDKLYASYYKIFRSETTPENWSLIDSTDLNFYSDVPETFGNYYYRLTAVSPYQTESGPSASAMVNYDGRYDPPSGLTLIDRGSNFYLTWIDEGYYGYYNVYRSLDPDQNLVRIDSTFNTSYEDVPLIHDHYYYRVSIVGPNDMESEKSTAVGAYFDGRLDAPGQVQAVDRGLTVRITWGSVPWVGAYILYRSDDAETYPQIARISGNYLFYIDEPPQAGTYLYKVSTETVDGIEGPLSQAASVYFSDNLSRPENVNAYNFGTYVNVAWDGVTDATEYIIFRSPSAVGGYVEIATSGSPAFTDAPQFPRAYYYKVRAIDNLGHESPFSFYAYVYYTDAPLPPHNVIASDQVHNILVQWNSYGDNYDYVVYRSLDPTGEYYAIDTTTAYSINDWPATAGHYYYKVQSIAGPGQVSELSDDAHVYFSGILDTPANLQADTVGGYVSLTWDAVQGAAEYDVYRGTSEIELDLIQTVYSPECTDAPSTGGTYYYAITAKTEGDLESPRSAPVIVVYEP